MSSLRVTLAAAALALLTACQPVDDEATPDPTGSASSTTPPPTALGDDVVGLLAGQLTTAQEWQAEPVAVEIVAELSDGTWTSASTMYLAPDADRFLVVTAGEGPGQQRPTLATLGIEAVPAHAVAEIPPFPELAQGPLALAEAAQEPLEACGADGEVTSVVYGTGAPASWDGERWTEPPRWTATVSSSGGAVVLDPVTAEPQPESCISGR